MTVTRNDDTLRVGRDFVDAEIGAPVCHGRIATRNGRKLSWVATVPINEAEKALRSAAKAERLRVTYFESQNL